MNMNTGHGELFSLSRPSPEETEYQKYIRAFAEGDDLPKAEDLFCDEFTKLIRISDTIDDTAVQSMVVFGRDLFGFERGQFLIDCCIKAAGGAIEVVDKLLLHQAV